MNYPRKCDKCKKGHCEKDCLALKEMLIMDSVNIKRWAKEHNKLHNQIDDEFCIFSLKCKYRGMIINRILPHVGRCFHADAPNYTQGCTNCAAHRCPRLNLTPC
jgi:hypothetical protein